MRRLATLILVLLVMASVGSISVGQGGDGIVHTGAPAEGAVAPQSMEEALAEVSALLSGEGLAKAGAAQPAVTVHFENLDGTPITSIVKGNGVKVIAEHAPVSPLKGTCILVLPIKPDYPGYKELTFQVRQVPSPGARAEEYNFHIPTWVQIGGTAIALVIVQDAGTGFATLTVVP